MCKHEVFLSENCRSIAHQVCQAYHVHSDYILRAYSARIGILHARCAGTAMCTLLCALYMMCVCKHQKGLACMQHVPGQLYFLHCALRSRYAKHIKCTGIAMRLDTLKGVEGVSTLCRECIRTLCSVYEVCTQTTGRVCIVCIVCTFRPGNCVLCTVYCGYCGSGM